MKIQNILRPTKFEYLFFSVKLGTETKRIETNEENDKHNSLLTTIEEESFSLLTRNVIKSVVDLRVLSPIPRGCM